MLPITVPLKNNFSLNHVLHVVKICHSLYDIVDIFGSQTRKSSLHILHICKTCQNSKWSDLSMIKYNWSFCLDDNFHICLLWHFTPVLQQEAVKGTIFLSLQALTHWGRDKMAAVFQTTLSNAFSWMKMLWFWLKCHWSSFLLVQLTIF